MRCNAHNLHKHSVPLNPDRSALGPGVDSRIPCVRTGMFTCQFREPIQRMPNSTVFGRLGRIEQDKNLSRIFRYLGAIGVRDGASEGAVAIGADELAGDIDLLADSAVDLIARTHSYVDVANDVLAIVGTEGKQ